MMNDYLERRSKRSPSAWSADAREWAEGSGIIAEDKNGNKSYKSFCTREEMVTFLQRMEKA